MASGSSRHNGLVPITIVPSTLPRIVLAERDIIPGSDSDTVVFDKTEWDDPVTFFVGRNGSRKSRVARAIAQSDQEYRILATDRL
jgi:hypothetical protein